MGKELRLDINSNATKGFASNSPVQQKYVSSKGGRVKTKKGLGAMPPDKAAEIQRKGGLARQQQLRNSVSTDNPKRKEQNGKDSIPSGNEGHRR